MAFFNRTNKIYLFGSFLSEKMSLSVLLPINKVQGLLFKTNNVVS